ncbi:NUDIX hydrolase [Paucihalobacter sp.]|uniref:NUDIX hydrolase n=1 Tax=Paucihalobacter sp. TaxID=2850405 RepID=UPI002FE1C4D2
MNFGLFLDKIVHLEHLPLPGETAQFKMSPPYRQALLKMNEQVIKNSKKAAVMALFYPNINNETYIVLIKRKSYKGVHSAQFAFPGGKVEKSDVTLMDTALRETEEEIGIPKNNIINIKQLTELYIPPSNFTVFPYFGTLLNTPIFIKQESEVDAIVEVSLKDFLNEKMISTTIVKTSYNIEVEVPAYNLNGNIVWGATAMMLSEIKELLNKVL